MAVTMLLFSKHKIQAAWAVAKEEPALCAITGVSLAFGVVQSGCAVAFAKTGSAYAGAAGFESVLGAAFFLALATEGVQHIRQAYRKKSIRRLYGHSPQ